MRNFREMIIWNLGMEIVKKSYDLTRAFPTDEKYGLKSQIKRAAVSIPSNIAEGASRDSEKEFSHFLQISIGSAFELETQLEIAHNVGFIEKDSLNQILSKLTEEQKMLNSFIQTLKSK